MSDKPTDWNLEVEVEKLLKDPKRHIQIIGLWVKEKGLRPENKEQMDANIIKRNLRPARALNGYTDNDIRETIRVIKNTEYITKFELETVSKFIDEVVSQKKKEGQKIVKFEKVRQPDGRITMKAIYEKRGSLVE